MTDDWESEEEWREDEMGMKAKRDLCDKDGINGFISSSSSCSVILSLTPTNALSRLSFPLCVFLRHWYSPLQRAEMNLCHVNSARLFSHTQTHTCGHTLALPMWFFSLLFHPASLVSSTAPAEQSNWIWNNLIAVIIFARTHLRKMKIQRRTDSKWKHFC